MMRHIRFRWVGVWGVLLFAKSRGPISRSSSMISPHIGASTAIGRGRGGEPQKELRRSSIAKRKRSSTHGRTHRLEAATDGSRQSRSRTATVSFATSSSERTESSAGTPGPQAARATRSKRASPAWPRPTTSTSSSRRTSPFSSGPTSTSPSGSSRASTSSSRPRRPRRPPCGTSMSPTSRRLPHRAASTRGRCSPPGPPRPPPLRPAGSGDSRGRKRP